MPVQSNVLHGRFFVRDNYLLIKDISCDLYF